MRKLKLGIFMGKYPAFALKKTDLHLFKSQKIMTKVIIASVIMGSVTIMASVTYGKSIMSSVIMAKKLWQMKLSQNKKLKKF